MAPNHNTTDYNRAFAFGVTLNIIFVLIEIFYGLFADSLALIADAGHNVSDVLGLLLAWGASFLASKPATENRTYGLRKTTVLASMMSAVILLFALGGITWEAIGRLFTPKEVEGSTVIVVAAIGVIINTLTALLFIKSQKEDLNIRGAFLHMAADAAVSLGVVISGIIILFTDWLWIDPVLSLIIVLVIFIGTWGLLRESVYYILDFVPKNIDNISIRQYLENIDKVESIHDLHIWPLSTTETALTVHLVIKDEILDNTFLSDIQQNLHDHFGIEHSTIQIETVNANTECLLNNNC